MVTFDEEGKVITMIGDPSVPILQGAHKKELRAKECIIG